MLFLGLAAFTLQVIVTVCSTPASGNVPSKAVQNVFNISYSMTTDSLEIMSGSACMFARQESQITLHIPNECWPFLSSLMLIT